MQITVTQLSGDKSDFNFGTSLLFPYKGGEENQYVSLWFNMPSLGDADLMTGYPITCADESCPTGNLVGKDMFDTVDAQVEIQYVGSDADKPFFCNWRPVFALTSVYYGESSIVMQGQFPYSNNEIAT